jgi:hypothetical protein
MGTHRTTILIGALSATVFVAAPGPAAASTLLSGYGGPGEGNQAMLGSTMINGPRGGGSSGGGSSSSTAGEGRSTAGGADGASAGEPTNAGGSSSGPASGAGARRGGPAGAAAGDGAVARRSAHGGASVAQSKLTAASFYPAAERIPAGASNGTLGISAGDLVLIAIALVALMLIGLLTSRAAQRPTNVPGGHG